VNLGFEFHAEFLNDNNFGNRPGMVIFRLCLITCHALKIEAVEKT